MREGLPGHIIVSAAKWHLSIPSGEAGSSSPPFSYVAGDLASHGTPAIKRRASSPESLFLKLRWPMFMDRVKGKDPLSSGASWLFGKGVWLSAYNQTTLGLVMSCLHRCRSDFQSHQKERGGGGVGEQWLLPDGL